MNRAKLDEGFKTRFYLIYFRNVKLRTLCFMYDVYKRSINTILTNIR